LSSSERCWSVGASAKEWLSAGSAASTVIHVFPSSFYLKTAGGELVAVTRKGVRSPVALNLKEGGQSFQDLLKVGSQARLDGARLSVGPLAFEVTADEFRNVDVLALADRPRMRKFGMVVMAASTMLQALNLSESFVDVEGKAFAQYSSFLRGTFSIEAPFSPEKFLEGATERLGLGGGFTPSFDDFAAGFLCIYNLGRRLLRRKPLLIEAGAAVGRTSWASARLLEYMQRGLMDEEVEGVASALFRGDGDSFLLSMEDVISRGHSSGLDMSVGMVLASAVVVDPLSESYLAARAVGQMGF
jgi:hypothetical protein